MFLNEMSRNYIYAGVRVDVRGQMSCVLYYYNHITICPVTIQGQ